MQISEQFQWRCLTPADGKHYFFGYYDRNPWDASVTRHLTLRVDQCNHVPERGETVELRYVSPDKEFVKLTTTCACCHPQGCMSLWLKHRPECFIYNDYEPETGRIIARIPRRGYSYADAVLPADVRHPDLDRDGVFLMDLHTSESRLLVSYRQMAAIHPVAYMLKEM